MAEILRPNDDNNRPRTSRMSDRQLKFAVAAAAVGIAAGGAGLIFLRVLNNEEKPAITRKLDSTKKGPTQDDAAVNPQGTAEQSTDSNQKSEDTPKVQKGDEPEKRESGESKERKSGVNAKEEASQEPEDHAEKDKANGIVHPKWEDIARELAAMDAGRAGQYHSNSVQHPKWQDVYAKLRAMSSGRGIIMPSTRTVMPQGANSADQYGQRRGDRPLDKRGAEATFGKEQGSFGPHTTAPAKKPSAQQGHASISKTPVPLRGGITMPHASRPASRPGYDIHAKVETDILKVFRLKSEKGNSNKNPEQLYYEVMGEAANVNRAELAIFKAELADSKNPLVRKGLLRKKGKTFAITKKGLSALSGPAKIKSKTL